VKDSHSKIIEVIMVLLLQPEEFTQRSANYRAH
jgi:hypothetical protein